MRLILIALALITSASFSAARADESLTCAKPKSNPYVCPWRLQPDRQSIVWLGVKDKSNPYDVNKSPLFLGPAYGGSTMCDRFSAYFFENRANLNTAACHIRYYGDPQAPTALIYVNIKGQNVPKTLPPTDPDLNWLYLGFASPSEIKIRAEGQLKQCETVLAFVKYYQSLCK